MINSRPSKNKPSVWRRRHCDSCSSVFTTREVVDFESIDIRVSNGAAITPLDPSKLLLSIASALEISDKTNKSYAAFWLMETAISRLLPKQKDQSLVLATDISKAAYEVLYRYDPLSGAQYGLKKGILSPGSPKMIR